MSEGLYFIKVDLPEKENRYLKRLTKKVSEMTKTGSTIEEKFHLTIEESLYCPRGAIRVDLDNWLGMQGPFSFTLDLIDCFERKNGLVYLTMSDLAKRRQITDFHYGVHEIIKSQDLDRQNNFTYTPHVTLLKGVALEKLDEVKSLFEENLKPIEFNLGEITVREKRGNGWEDFKKFSLGGESWDENDFVRQKTAVYL